MRTVLIVEDNRELQALYRAMIEYSYPEVVVTPTFNGEEALDKIEKQECYALISDINMPGMNGMEFYKALKEKNAALAKRTIFITSGYDNPEYASFLASEGLPFLGKPFERDDFISCLDKILHDEDAPSNNSGSPASSGAKA